MTLAEQSAIKKHSVATGFYFLAANAMETMNALYL